MTEDQSAIVVDEVPAAPAAPAAEMPAEESAE